MGDGPKVSLEFFGHVYHLTGRDTDEVDLREVVDHVEKTSQKIIMEYPNLPGHKQIVLTVLSITRDLLKAKKDLNNLETRLANIVHKIATH